MNATPPTDGVLDVLRKATDTVKLAADVMLAAARAGVDYPGLCVSFFLHDGQGNLLWQLRSSKCRNEQGKWDVGAGGVNVGETFKQAALREIEEEYGVKLTPLELEELGTREAISDGFHWVARDFFVQVDPKLVRIAEPDYVDEIKWLGFGITPDNIHLALPPIIDTYFKEMQRRRNVALDSGRWR